MAVIDTVVVGGGFAGLAAAVRLTQAGLRVLAVEARPRLGGRATAFPDRVTGALVDNGQHVMFGCYTETLDFLRTIGAAANVRLQPSLDVPFIDVRGRVTRLRCPDLPSPFHLAGGLIDWDALRWRDRWAALRVWRAVTRHEARGTRPEDEEGDGQTSVAEWLRSLRQTRRLRDFLWEPLAVAALNEPPELASADAFARVLSLMFGNGPAHAAVAMPAVPLDEMYARPARAFIESRGGTVRLNALAKVVVDDGAVSGVRIGSEMVPCRSVVSSVPWNTFGSLFDSIPRALQDTAATAARITSRPIVTANLWFDRPVMEEPFVGLPGCTIQWAFEKGRDASHLSCTVSGAIELVDRTNEEILRIAEADIRSRLTRARRAALVRGTVVRERHATFATAQRDVRRPATVTAVPGFFLAGDWIDTGLPGTIEGAVRSGNAAAEAVITKSPIHQITRSPDP